MHIKLRLLVLLLAATGGAASGADWYHTWRYRQEIVIDGNQVSGTGTLTNFPVLLTEANVQPAVWTCARTNGADILFTAADGTTKIPHEFEVYDAGASQLLAWVRIPALSGATNTSIYMYYGKAYANDQRDKAGVWADYRAVWHLEEASGTRYDSTTNNSHGTPVGGVTRTAAGRIGGAAAFDAIDGRIAASGGGKVVYTNGTVSMWMHVPADEAAARTPFNTTWASGVLIRKESTGVGMLQLFVVSGSLTLSDSTFFTGTSGQWTYLTLTLNSGAVRLYRNGVFRAAGVYTGTPNISSAGLGSEGTSRYWKGGLDEIRVSKNVHSDDWMVTEYNNQTAPGTFAAASPPEGFPMTRTAAPWRQWEYRQRLEVVAGQVAGELTNFPVLVTGRTVDPALWAHAAADGSDILFTRADGSTPVPHELERYDGVISQAWMWVQLPAVSSVSNTAFYLYYGKQDAGDLQNRKDLWADYRAVWHLSETSGTRYDSTTNGNNGTPAGGVSVTSTGLIGRAGEFDGVAGTQIAVSGGKLMYGNGTISAWLWQPSLANSRAFFDTTYTGGVLMRTADTGGGGVYVFVRSGSATNNVGYFTGLAQKWVYLTLVLEDGAFRLYRNGVHRASGTYAGTVDRSSGVLGAGSPGTPWPGRMDEVRVSMSVQSPAWMATEYNNQFSPITFIDDFLEEAIPKGTVILVR